MYKVRCVDVKEDLLENASFGNGDIIRFTLETEDKYDPEGNPAQMDAIANDKLTPKSKLTRWLEAFGVKAEVGKTIDIEDCVDKYAQAKVVAKVDDSGKDTGFTKVDDLLPLGRQQVSKPMAEMTVEEWWPEVRSAGITQKEARDRAVSMFKREPKDLTGEERKQVYEAF